MSALCCAAPGANGASSASVYYPYTRSSASSYAYHLDLNPYAAAAAAAAAAMATASRQSGGHEPVYAQCVAHDELAVSARVRRKRLESAVTEAIPTASSGKVSQRIAQLQQSLYSAASGVQLQQHQQQQQQRHPLLPASSAPRALSLDPLKDYSQSLSVDCSIEYDLARLARPPPGAQPLLLVAPRRLQSPPQQQQQRTWPNQVYHSQCVYSDACGAPVSSCSSDSGRGTDSERAPSPQVGQYSGYGGAWTGGQPWTATPTAQRIKVNYQKAAVAVHPRPAEGVRSQRMSTTSEMPSCPCCARVNPAPVQRWAPYSTSAARHACPAPSFIGQQQQQQQSSYYNEQQYGWARWHCGASPATQQAYAPGVAAPLAYV